MDIKMRYEEFVRIQLEKLKKAGIIDETQLPDIDLYIDQAESFFSKQLNELDDRSQKWSITKAMINNYAKNDIISRPMGKKYSKDHLIMLAMTMYFKGIFKMEEIQLLMKPLVDNHKSVFEDTIDPAVIYRTACSTIEEYTEKFPDIVENDMSKIKKGIEDTDIADDERMEVFILILVLAIKADMEKYIASQLLDTYFIKPALEKHEKTKKQKKTPDDKRAKADKKLETNKIERG